LFSRFGEEQKEELEYISGLFINTSYKNTNNVSTANYIMNFDPSNFLESDEERKVRGGIKCCTIYIYNYITSLTTGSFFGDRGLSSKNKKRNSTIIISSDTHLGILDYKAYEECIKDGIDKVRRIDLNAILNAELLKYVNKSLFEKNFFSMFNKTKFMRGHKLIKSGSSRSNIFIITEGEYELNMHASLVGIKKLIQELGGEISFEQESKEYDLMNNNETFKNFMNELRLFKVLIIKDNDLIGLHDIIINNKFICNIECISTKGEAFSIETKVTK